MDKYDSITYTSKEKEVLEKIRIFTENLEKIKKENLSQELIKEIRYYEVFEIANLKMENVYVVVLEDEEKDKISEIYINDAKNKIVRMNEKIEEIAIDENIQKVLDFNNISKEELNEYIDSLNDSNLKVKTQNISKEEMTKELQSRDKSINKDEKKELVSKDLSKNMETDEDLEISFYKEIIDDRMGLEFPKITNNADEVGIAYSERLNAFICVTKTSDGYKMAEGTKPSRPTLKTVISIDEKGEKVEETVPYALIETQDEDKELCINIDSSGGIETQNVTRTNSNYRIGRKLDSQGEQEVSTKEVKDLVQDYNKDGDKKLDEIAKNYKENEALGDKIQTIDDIQRNDDWIIDLEDGTQIIMDEEAKKARVSVEEFKEYYLKAEGKNPQEKMENAHEDLETDYRHPGKKR